MTVNKERAYYAQPQNQVPQAPARQRKAPFQCTVVPAKFFDALVNDLDEPAKANEAMVRAIQRSRVWSRGASSNLDA